MRRLAAACMLVGFTLVGCAQTSPQTKGESTQNAATQEDDQKVVILYGGRFNPDEISVAKGTSIVFKNKDREKHNVKIAALDVDTIYQVPISYHEQGFDDQVLAYFDLSRDGEPDLSRWQRIADCIRHPEGEVTIAVVGKYTSLIDSYKSLAEALTHGGIANNARVKLDWIDAEVFESDGAVQRLERIAVAALQVRRIGREIAGRAGRGRGPWSKPGSTG